MPDLPAHGKASLSFAKLVATPTDTAWSQVYNTGDVFACLALSLDTEEGQTLDKDAVSLQTIGRETFAVLQKEFFALEDKTPSNIKEVIAVSLEHVPPEIAVSLTLAYFRHDALSVFVSGSGKVILKRNERIGTLLECEETEDDAGLSATGFVKNNDTIILQTGDFAASIESTTLQGALDLNLPTDIVEALSPQVLEQQNGAQAAMVIVYHGSPISHPEPSLAESETVISDEAVTATKKNEEQIDEPKSVDEQSKSPEGATLGALIAEAKEQEELDTTEEKSAIHPSVKERLSQQLLPLKHRLPQIEMNQRQKVFLYLALIIVLLLGASIFFTLKQHADAQQHERFKQTYSQAQQLYEEGQGLESLNPSLSQENYQKAEKLLISEQKEFGHGTDEYQQTQSLLSKVQTALGTVSEGAVVAVKELAPAKNSLLAVATNASAKAYGEDANAVYTISTNTLTSVTKSSGSKKDLAKNTSTWSKPKALVPYQTNLYVLDQKVGVIKFVSNADGYTASKYFSGTAPDLSKATGMAIDGSVWILFSDGTINKYTSGKKDAFSVTGLDAPFKNPTALTTDLEMSKLYVLDAGNNRIVQLSKAGAFEKAYKAPQLNNATIFTVAADGKNADFLSNGKGWQITF